ncbi:centrosomal protein of 162 kDa [Anthonomus grandis grandis]|uniref:centrosomal protein of 162 kDa n=1 Tax=Anthonomus grandis grandis TaxID=2921223 RepID=UPI002165F118|nr:centrosomal protein of 162 kDa [Anthonomus grandis grandis]
METKKPAAFWWMKSTPKETPPETHQVPKLDLKSANSITSLTDLLQDEKDPGDYEVDVDSILEEISRVAAQSPLGPFEKSVGERSIEDIMKETEKVYMESSKSFEQLSQRSKTSQNISDLLSSNSNISTPTPKSVSPLPMDPGDKEELKDYNSDYSDDFSTDSKTESEKSHKSSAQLDKLYDAMENNEKSSSKSSTSSLGITEQQNKLANTLSKTSKSLSLIKSSFKLPVTSPMASINATPRGPSPKSDSSKPQSPGSPFLSTNTSPVKAPSPLETPKVKLTEARIDIIAPTEKPLGYEQGNLIVDDQKVSELRQEVEIRNKLIKTLEEDNEGLRSDIKTLRGDLETTHALIQRLKSELTARTLSSPEINLELEKALEELKDSKEINTSLQLQLDTVNKSHQLLKGSYDDLLASNKNLERKMVEFDATLSKYKTELLNLQQAKTKLLDNEANLNKLLEIEKLQSKSLKLQNEKDSKSIQDLNRQIKEMERIIARKHPDSVSGLIVSKQTTSDTTDLTARKLLEDRIKALEQEAASRDSQSSKVFLEIQEKFSQMKNKYESHIEDLELHVNDLKEQLKKKIDTYDVYTQTFFNEKIAKKETFTIAIQTDVVPKQRPPLVSAKRPASDKEGHKEDAHLMATIRGLQADLTNKEKVIQKMQKEIDELRKTNRRLQKEREGSLRNLSDRKDFRSYPERLASQSRADSVQDIRKEEELQQLKVERDRLKQQLSRLESEFQGLKKKRLDDLTALQEAHEREISNYVSSVTPLREQLELHQVTINTLQSQLTKAKEELAVLSVERDHLNTRLISNYGGAGDGLEVDALRKKITFLEKRYEEREYRLRAIVQSLAQKTVMNRSCEQCAERQQQLIGYKVELDQLLATVRALK